MTDFDNLRTKINAVNLTGVASSDYTPTATPTSCPAVNASWEASPALPPTPNEAACSCMVRACGCVPAASIEKEAYGALFGFVCGGDTSLCAGIAANATAGTYGSFSMCSSREQLAYVLDAYYRSTGSSADACDFKGQAATQTATGSASRCVALAGATGSAGAGDKALATVRTGALAQGVSLHIATALLAAGVIAAGL